jgi:hypothetical protein
MQPAIRLLRMDLHVNACNTLGNSLVKKWIFAFYVCRCCTR